MERLLSRPTYPRVGLVDGQRDRHDRDHVPRVVEGEEGEDRAEAGLGRRRGEVGLQHLQAADHLEQAARDEQVHERQHGQRDEVVRQLEVPRGPAAERERVAGGGRREREGRGLEGGVAPRAAHDSRQQGGRARRRALRATGRARSRRPGRRRRRRGRRPARPARGCARSPAPRAARRRARPHRTARAPSAAGRQPRRPRPRWHRDRPRRSRRRGRIAASSVYRVPRGNPLDLHAGLH